VTNPQPSDPATDETSQVKIPATHGECANPVEAALWRALREARRERDEARRKLCDIFANEIRHRIPNTDTWPDSNANARMRVAAEFGWDCYEDEAK
jgi:hypothetical protein